MSRIRIRPIDPPETDLLDARPELVWLSPDTSIYGWGESFRLAPGFGPDRFDRAETGWLEWLDRNPVDDPDDSGGPVAFASFTFDDRSAGSVLVVPSVTVMRRSERWFEIGVDGASLIGTMRLPAPDSPPDRPRYAGASIPDVQWLESVAIATDEIAAGTVEKVVLARDYALWSKTAFDPIRLLTRLHARFPDCFTFRVDGLVGASPELLIERRGRDVTSLTLAGSAPRADDPAEDARIGEELLTSDKDRREHASATASVGRVLDELCERTERDPEPSLLRLANVQHLATRFAGRLRAPLSALAVAGRLHPTAAVGGTPTAAAVDLIRRLEHMDRGRYAGPVGWIDGTGDGEFAIALRCAEISGARARLFAGAGIVRGSLPEAELEETRIKLLAMQSAFE